MDTVRRIAKNTGLMLLANIVSRIIGFFSVMLTARYLGVQGFGIISFAFALSGILVVLTDFGLTPLTVREVARARASAGKYLVNVSLIKSALGLLTIALAAFVTAMMGSNAETRVVAVIVMASVVTVSFSQVFLSIFQSFERLEFVSLSQVLGALFTLLGIILAIKMGVDVRGFAVMHLLVAVLLVIYGYIAMRMLSRREAPEDSEPAKIDPFFWKAMLLSASPFFFSMVVDVIAFRIDMVMLAAMKGDEMVGWYGASYKFIEVLMFIPAALMAAAYPALSRTFTSARGSFERAYEKALKYLLIIALPIAAGTTVLADRVMFIVFGAGFSPAVLSLQILIWTAPLIFLTYMYGTILAAMDRQPAAFKINLACMLLNIGLNLWLIPKYGFIGASFVTVLTSLLSLVMCHIFVSMKLCKMSILRVGAKPAIASIVMVLAILFVFKGLGFVLTALGSATVYALVMLALKGLSADDYSLFRGVLGLKERAQ